MAHPEDAIEEASVPAMAAASQADDQADLAEQWNSYAKDDGAAETPVVESPSIASDWPTEDAAETEDDWAAALLEKLLRAADYPGLRREQAALRRRG